MSRVVMQQALEALESDHPDTQLRAAIALRAALAEPECKCTMTQKMVGDGCAVCNPERAKDLAEPEQNPFGDDAERYARKLHEEREYYKALFTAPTPQPEQKQEPVAWMESPHGVIRANPLYRIKAPQSVAWSIPLYTAPTPRKPLTDGEIWNTYKNLWMFHPAEEPRLAGDVLKFARAIERHHGIGEQHGS